MKPACVFVSNYLNHHQIPFCDAMYENLRGSYRFIQTEPMEEERVKMGWNDNVTQPYLQYYYKEPEICKNIISDAELVIFGGTDDETYIEERLQAGKPVIRYSERLYKTGQWKAVSPRGLKKKYHDHTRYRKAPVYLLCAGAYVPSDFHIIRAYKDKMFCWGYFPETKVYELQSLMEEKKQNSVPKLLWAGRMIDWKHPELAVETAAYLKAKGLDFHMDMIGGGELEEKVTGLITEKGLQDVITLQGFLPPARVRQFMEKADIYLFTSDRQEGWGAVANEAMNSGCALVANHRIGAVPYLVRQGINAFAYKDGCKEQLFSITERLVKDEKLRRKLGENAYHTITRQWNARQAAYNLAGLCVDLKLLPEERFVVKAAIPESGPQRELFPGAPAPVISEAGMYRWMKENGEVWKID